MADGETRNIGAEENESKVCTKKCTIITVSVITAMAVLVGVIVAIVLLIPGKWQNKLFEEKLRELYLNTSL